MARIIVAKRNFALNFPPYRKILRTALSLMWKVPYISSIEHRTLQEIEMGIIWSASITVPFTGCVFAASSVYSVLWVPTSWLRGWVGCLAKLGRAKQLVARETRRASWGWNPCSMPPQEEGFFINFMMFISEIRYNNYQLIQINWVMSSCLFIYMMPPNIKR